MSVSPVVSEVRTGLRQNATMTIAVVVTVAVSLALLGLGLLIGKQINVMKGYWYDKVEVAVYLTPDVTPAERDALNAELRADPLVSQVTYESQQDAYQRFKDQFKNSPGLVDEVNPDELQKTLRIKLDLREGVTPGFKFNDWEMRGVPLRIEIGPRDLAAGSVTLSRRDRPGREGKTAAAARRR